MSGPELGFPLIVRITHWFNFLFLSMMVRSGLSILSAHPKLYWNNNCRPGLEWLRLTRKKMPEGRLWASTDEEEQWSHWLALPGGDGLGLGRYWHLACATGWMATGALYLILLFTSSQWQRLVPTSFSIFSEAWEVTKTYLSFQIPHPGNSSNPNHPFNALQQLAYFAVIFFLAPLMIVTGMAQSPAVIDRFLGRFHGRLQFFKNRQAARSIHFIGLVVFFLFFVVHLSIVIIHGFLAEMNKIVLGIESEVATTSLGAWVGIGIVILVIILHFLANYFSTNWPRKVHKSLFPLVKILPHRLLYPLNSVQQFSEEEISPFFRINGYAPISQFPKAKGNDETFERLLAQDFREYRLEIGGLVYRPLKLTMNDLRSMPSRSQITLHNCIQGWTAVGKWRGVWLKDILNLCMPFPEVHYIAFYSFQMHEKSGKPYYEVINIREASKPQTILAYELNDQALPLHHGAPLRLRLETKLGFKMVKFIRAIELRDDYKDVGRGFGGVREDEQQYDMGAEI